MKIIDSLNFEYFIEKNNFQFYFNFIDKNDLNTYHNYFLINKKNLLNFIKYFSCYKDFYELKKCFGDNDIFFIKEELYNKKITQYFISHFLPLNSYIYIYIKDEEINGLNFRSLKKYLKLKFKERMKRNDLKTFEIINIFISNLSVWKNYEYNFCDAFETLNSIKKKNIVRFGDGELSLARNNGGQAAYQVSNDDLSNDMRESIKYFSKKNCVALNDKIVLKTKYINKKDMTQFDFIKSINLNDFFNQKKAYSACCWAMPPYIISRKIKNYLFDVITIFCNNKNYSIFDKELYKFDNGKKFLNDYNEYFYNFFQDICKDKNVVFISGDSNKWFLKCNLLENCKNKIFITTPDINSYMKKNQIINEINKIIDLYKNTNIIFLISCGPLGKILAKYIDKKNYRFIDIGNFINYYAYYNNMLNIEYVNVVHNPKVFLEEKKKLNFNFHI